MREQRENLWLTRYLTCQGVLELRSSQRSKECRMAVLKLCIFLALAALLGMCQADKDPILYCDTCKGMIDEINWAMDQGM